MPKRVLVVDDDPAQRRILEEAIKRFGYHVSTAESGDKALAALKADTPGDICLVLLDLVMPGTDGLAVLSAMRSLPRKPPAIVQTAHGSIDAAITAMRAGAVDFVVKPVSPERLEVSIKNALKIEALADELIRIKASARGDLGFADLIAASESMTRVLELGKRAAGSTIPVLIEGESGVGKELIARAIRGESGRKSGPFVTVNCGAIPENLVESILFGHEKGSFTGASEKRTGKFLEADHGTLFLDEIGELPLDAQVKLLRALQDGEIDPVGAKHKVKVDFRLISATNQNLIALVIDDEAIAMLERYSWPGNIRQLENAVFRAVVLADTPMLTVNEFPQIAAHVEGYAVTVPPAPAPKDKAPRIEGPVMLGESAGTPATIHVPQANSKDAIGIPALSDTGDIRSLDAVEADMIRLAFGLYRGRMTEIARRLGIGRSTLYRKMREIGLEARAN